MNMRRVMLDVDTAASGPSVLQLGETIAGVGSVEAANLRVTEIDLDRGLVVTVDPGTGAGRGDHRRGLAGPCVPGRAPIFALARYTGGAEAMELAEAAWLMAPTWR
jgi:hypothetical protein